MVCCDRPQPACQANIFGSSYNTAFTKLFLTILAKRFLCKGCGNVLLNFDDSDNLLTTLMHKRTATIALV